MQYDVITIGSATRDVFLRSRDLLTVRSSRFKTGAGECLPLGSRAEIDDVFFTIGGSAANTAVTFARRGFRTAMVGKVGFDAHGGEIIRTLARERVQTRYIVKDPARQTPYSVVILTPSAERSILVYRGAGEELTPKDAKVSRLRTRWFYVTHLGGRSSVLFPKILSHARTVGACVAVNPGKTQLGMPFSEWKPLLASVDVFIVNREEASMLTKIPYAREEAIFTKLDRLVRGFVVMTDGPGGVTVSDGITRWHAGILRERRRVDRTGAGDSFGSGFVAGLLAQPGNVPYALQVGSANATSNIETIGAQTGLLGKHDSIYRWGRLAIKKTKIQQP